MSAYFASQSPHQACKHLWSEVGQFRLGYVADWYSVDDGGGLPTMGGYGGGRPLGFVKLAVGHLSKVQNYVFGQLLLAHVGNRPAEPRCTVGRVPLLPDRL